MTAHGRLPGKTERRLVAAAGRGYAGAVTSGMSAVPYSDLLGAWDPIAVLADTPVHPEFGEISVDWVIRVLAGHDLHHLQHLRAIAER